MLDLSPGNGNLFILKGLLNATRDSFRITKSILIQVLIILYIYLIHIKITAVQVIISKTSQCIKILLFYFPYF